MTLFNTPAYIDGIEASRRVGWAKFFEEAAANDQLEMVNGVLLDELNALAEAVLAGRKAEAFSRAWRIRNTGPDVSVLA